MTTSLQSVYSCLERAGHKFLERAPSKRDAHITAIALVIVAALFFIGAFLLYGLGTLSPMAFGGLGIFSYLGGIASHYIGLILLISAVGFAALDGSHKVALRPS